MDLIKTIGDEDEVPDYSETSDEEEEYQPTKQKKRKKKDFECDFAFASSTQDYNKDTWNDIQKYIKRNVKSKVDDKILKARKNLKKEEVEENGDSDIEDEEAIMGNGKNNSDSEISLSDDELKKDTLKLKQKRKKVKKMGLIKKESDEEEEEEFFEDAPPYDEKASFYEMNLSRPLLKAIGAMSFVHPTPIQAATIPVALMGRDICGCAATGTGKTAAYMLPTLERLIYKPLSGAPVTRVVVLVPTRELGVQVYSVTRQLAQFTKIDVALSVGGLDVKVQEQMLRKSPDIVIATPGRLIDHIRNAPSFSIDQVEVLILDEADRILDEYFQEQLHEIVKQCSRTRQTLLFSATMTDAVRDLASVSLDKPVRIFVDNNQDVAFNLRQEFVKIRQKYEPYREAILASLVCRTFHSSTMVFVQTKKEAHRVHIMLGLLGVKVAELHGNMSQPQRMEALRRFKDSEVDVLVATDVAARGLDIRNVKTVINFVMPPSLEHYIHRVGRTARAGRAGVSVSMCGESERKIVKEIIKRARNPVKSRIVPVEILEKYRKKVEKLEGEIEAILKEEEAERLLAKAENQANKVENLMKEKGKGMGERPREWFQSTKERMKEKERQKLGKGESEKKKGGKKRKNEDEEGELEVGKEGRKRGKKEVGDAAESRVKNEMEKVALLQARMAKRKGQKRRMNAVYDPANKVANGNVGGKKRKNSAFDSDLTDVSNRKVKSLRYDASKHKRDEQRNNKSNNNKNNNNKKDFKKPKRWK
ncbi:probable ATP-dependent RNA helicase DDX27 isoform X2 [Nilaparvata lugens]|uniref:probable ATP-dependent RNA helicase DDX27 isoform X2 n=1 Tax=Nilaparvata lugens TaxID=108931 RepID=UPI00193DB043|nr:probable ATP-dependent RNA helicase DDX27 isoform X2 [Nilaparvata lugens]